MWGSRKWRGLRRVPLQRAAGRLGPPHTHYTYLSSLSLQIGILQLVIAYRSSLWPGCASLPLVVLVLMLGVTRGMWRLLTVSTRLYSEQVLNSKRVIVDSHNTLTMAAVNTHI